MADYPIELERTRTLFDGRQVHIRPVRATDAAMEQDFVRHLSPDSRYARFMATLKELPADKLKYLTDVDYEHHLALVATVEDKGQDIEVGSARYVLDPSGKSCEFAVTIDDAWQGTGVAGMLMFAIMDVARARGLESMEGLVLASNHKMLKFARQLGFTQERVPDDPGTMRVFRKL
ncbi:GNAT family N-acetyltransferase [Nitrogeniibacter mangrovi]|uniref:GNAT family N-acetyltransferase n=1 Tax=Nitrogeniibacter mangrovi TaxID=2016596 RepID=A0A6C1B862_9RHOO|nr:GNAT family N-acetyltransferase [Nitrogeniibacter mangrovi]QID18434.1 GNAT family N-acetyltransferase [Nitrogeniibacter mangrovi]